MRIAITGASGNVGSALLRSLADDPQVTAITGIARREPGWTLPKTTWVRADVATSELRPVLEGADAVVHLAWLLRPSRPAQLQVQVNCEGSRRVFAAAVDAGVPAVVHASSVGAYSPGPRDADGGKVAVDESHPTDGIASSSYSRQKAYVERALDAVEARHPGLRVVRLRPSLIFQHQSAMQQLRYFAGPFVPHALVRRGVVPIAPVHTRLQTQALHADDVASAYHLAATGSARGAFNVATDPPVDGSVLAELLDARPVRVSPALLRALAAATYELRLQPSEPGWLDLLVESPLLDATRARTVLGWKPVHEPRAVIAEVLEGIAAGTTGPTPPLLAA